MLEKGDKAPDFSLPDQNGQVHHLADYQGQSVLIYFYPKDDTPGCTKEACTIADVYNDFERQGVKVFGVSADGPESHRQFAEKYNLPFTLLSDEDRAVIRAYGAEKGEGEGSGTKRISYLIAPDGTIAKSYPKVDPATHAHTILKDLT